MAKKTNVLEMEVVIASKGNPILLQWLDYIRQQIPGKRRKKFYKNAKIRYIHNTTGLNCMARFLRLRENREVMRKLEFISSNNFKQAALLYERDKKIFDVLSFESNSYFGERGIL